jgi:hypothetical protein
MYVGMYVGVCMYVCMYERIPSTLLGGDHVIPGVCFYIRSRRTGCESSPLQHSNIHIMCFEHVPIPYFGLIRASGLVSLAARLFVCQQPQKRSRIE